MNMIDISSIIDATNMSARRPCLMVEYR